MLVEGCAEKKGFLQGLEGSSSLCATTSQDTWQDPSFVHRTARCKQQADRLDPIFIPKKAGLCLTAGLFKKERPTGFDSIRPI